MKYLREFVAIGLALFVCLFLVAKCTGCKEARQAAAESAYTAEHLRCVDRAQSLLESQACRRDVDEKWGIIHVVRDAGGER